MAWIIQHPNGEYVTGIWNEKMGYIDTSRYQQLAHRYTRRVARDMINRFAPGWTAINLESGKTYQRN